MDLRTEINLENLTGLFWHLALAQPGQDPRAAEALRKRGYLVYRPTMPIRRLDRHRRLSLRWVSMFPGYLLVLPHPKGWEALRTTPGMRLAENALMRKSDGSLATIAGSHPDFIRIQQIELELSTEAMMAQDLENPFKPGDLVKINDGGAFHGQWHQIQSLDDDGRICLLLTMFGRPWPAHFEPQHLVSASA